MSTAPPATRALTTMKPLAGMPPCGAKLGPKVVSITARHRAAWDRYVRLHAQGTCFHTIAWKESVQEAFGHRAHYLMARCDGAVVGVLPLVEVRSMLAGTMLVSVPYAVAGGILADTQAARAALWQEARRLAEDAGARSIDLRSEVPQLQDLPVVERYVGFRRELPARAEDVLKWLPRKARAAARNAQNKHGLTTEFDEHYLRVVWRLYCRSMRRLASLCYPYGFFRALLERSRRDTCVQVVRCGDRIIAGLMSFRFRDAFIPYFVGCDERFKRLSVNNFLYMTAARRAVEVGCRVFDFGRTRVDNTGALDFKRFHGFEPRPLGYQRYVTGGGDGPDLTPSNPRFRLARSLWRHLPAPLCVRLGTWISRHVPG